MELVGGLHVSRPGMAHTLKDERLYGHGVTTLQRHGHPDSLVGEWKLFSLMELVFAVFPS